MSRLAIKKGQQTDELRRNKEKSRKTQAFLSETKKVQPSTMSAAEGAGGGTTMGKSLKGTMMSGSGSTGGPPAGSFIVELLLFG